MSPTFRNSEQTAKGERQAGDSLRVVIADDDRDSVLVLSTLFRDEGHGTKGVYAGDEVIAAIAEFEPHAALIDIMMPGMNGLDVAREVRGRYGLAAPLLIAVTAWNNPADKILARAAGFDEHVGKPYDPDELIGLVQERVRQRRSKDRDVLASIPFGGGVDTMHSRLLRKLAEVMGGSEPVRRALMVPTRDMARWIAGVEQMPTAVFVKATDLLIKVTPAPDGSHLPASRLSDTRDEDPSG